MLSMNRQIRASTLAIIATVSAVCLPQAYFIAKPVAIAANHILDYFWSSLDPATIWHNMAVSEYVFYATALLIGLTALGCGSLALHELYKRYKVGTVSDRLFIYPSIISGVSILLAFLFFAYL